MITQQHIFFKNHYSIKMRTFRLPVIGIVPYRKLFSIVISSITRFTRSYTCTIILSISVFLYTVALRYQRLVRVWNLREIQVVYRRAYSFIINHAYRSADTSMNNWQCGPIVNGSFLLNQLRATADLASGYENSR